MENRALIAVSIFIFRGDKVLTLQRSRRALAAPSIWEVVSGRVEAAEDPFAAAAREVREETGLSVALCPRPYDAYRAKRLEEPMLVLVYRADHLAGEVQLSEEHDAFEWIDPRDFAQRCSLPRLVRALEAIEAG